MLEVCQPAQAVADGGMVHRCCCTGAQQQRPHAHEPVLTHLQPRTVKAQLQSDTDAVDKSTWTCIPGALMQCKDQSFSALVHAASMVTDDCLLSL